jgi:hypothetical protein
LRDIVHEKDEVELDRVDAVFKNALFLDLPDVTEIEQMIREAAEALRHPLGIDPEQAAGLLRDQGRFRPRLGQSQ